MCQLPPCALNPPLKPFHPIPLAVNSVLPFSVRFTSAAAADSPACGCRQIRRNRRWPGRFRRPNATRLQGLEQGPPGAHPHHSPLACRNLAGTWRAVPSTILLAGDRS